MPDRHKLALLLSAAFIAPVLCGASAKAQSSATLGELSVEGARGARSGGAGPRVRVEARARSRAARSVPRPPSERIAQAPVAPAAPPVLAPPAPVGDRLPPPTGTVGQPPPPYAGGQVGSGTRLGVLGNRGVFNTPFNVTGYTNKLLRDQQAQNLIDVVENDPSVRPVGTISDAYGSGYVIRGFPILPSDVGFDGLFGIVDFRRPFIFNAERVEVFKGPSTVVNGAAPNGGVGGSINIIPKRAYDEPLTRITPFFISQGQFGTAVDLGRRFGEQKEWGVRANGVFQKGETAIDKEQLQLGFGSLAIDYRGERFRASIDFSYQDLDYRRNRGFLFVDPGVIIPRAPKLSRNVDQPGQYTRDNSLLGATRLEYDLTEDTTIYAAFGAGHYDGNSLTDFKNLAASDGTFRNLFVRQRYDSLTYTAETGLRSTFDTGPIRHTVSLAATGFWNDQSFPDPLQFAPAGLSNLYNPVLIPAPNLTDLNTGSARYSQFINRSIAFADTLSAFDDRVQLTVGGRVQQLTGRYFDSTIGSPTFGQANTRYDDGHISPAVALLVKPTERLSFYGNFVEALISPPPSPVPFATAALPAIGDQKEVGAKYDFGAFGTTLAFFEINRPNPVVNPVTLAFANDGLQRNRGIEFNLFGEPLPGLRLLGGATFFDGRLVRTAGNAFDGKVAPGVPDVQFNLYGEYDLPWLIDGLTATGRVIHTAKQFLDQGNTQSIPEWTRGDVGVRYTFLGSWGKPVTLRADVINVTNKNYWNSTAFSGLLSLGVPRTYMLSAQLDF